MWLMYCKLSEKDQDRLLELFVLEIAASSASDLTGIHRNSVIRFFRKLREKIAIEQEKRCEKLFGKIEIDESYFGGAKKGKRGRGAAGKIPVFGLLKIGEKVYTKIIKEAKSGAMMPIIREKVVPDSVVLRMDLRLTMPWMCQNLSIL